VSQIFKIDSVVLGDFVAEIREQGDFQFAQSSLSAVGLRPGVVREVRVDRAGDHLDVDFVEFSETVVEGQNFSRTHKSAEKKNTVLLKHLIKNNLSYIWEDKKFCCKSTKQSNKD